MMSPITIIVPGELPAMNEILKAAKSNRYKYSSMKRLHTNRVAYCARGSGTVDQADVTVIWHCKNRKKDKDNIEAGIKFVLDGLVVAGVLPNDGWRHVRDITHKFRVDKQDPRVEIIIREARDTEG